MSELDWVRGAVRAAHDVPLLGLWGVAFSSRAVPVIAAVVGLAMFAARRTRRRLAALVAGALAVAVADPLNHWVFKAWVMRPRPCHTDPAIETLVRCGTGYSFPSNHAADGVAAAVAVLIAARLAPGPAAAVLLAGLCVGASRVVVGVHYPSDVAVGWLVGAVCGTLAAFAALAMVKRAPAEWFAAPENAEAARP